MRQRTARFDAAISGSHQLATQADVYYNRAIFRSGLNVVSGSVTLDRTAAHLGRCDMVLAEPLLISPTGPLTPYGYEIAPQRGVTYADGTVELMALGVFPIQSASIDGVALTSTVTGMDRSQLVSDARLEDDYTIVAGTNYATAIQAIINAGVPGLTYTFTLTSYTTPALVFAAQTDRWEAAQGMAKSIGCELYFDGLGRCVLRPEPVYNGTTAWSLVEGTGGLLIDADLSLDREPAYNRVIATGENTGNTTVYRGEWTDSDPNSATYYFGGFGRKPRFYASPFITSNQQATDAASAIGAAQLGVARSLSFEGVPNPALEPGDAVLVRRDSLGLYEVHLIDTLTVDLSPERSMTGQSRSTAVTFTINAPDEDTPPPTTGIPAAAWTIDGTTAWTIDGTTYWETV